MPIRAIYSGTRSNTAEIGVQPCAVRAGLHAAFETDSQIGTTNRAQGDDDLLLIGIRPVFIGRWRGFLNGQIGEYPTFLAGVHRQTLARPCIHAIAQLSEGTMLANEKGRT